MKQILAKLAPPRFSDPDRSRQAELLNVLSLLLFVIMGLLIILNYVQRASLGGPVNFILVVLLFFQVVTQVLIRSGYVRLAGIVLLFISWIGITWFAAHSDGVRDAAMVAYVTVLIGAGYMYGWRAVMLFAAGSILAVWLLVYAEINGFMQFTLTSPGRVAVYLTALIVLVSFQVYYVMNTLKKALSESTSELNARHQAEGVLRSEQEKLNFALDAANMGTWSWDIATGTVEWSEKIAAMFGMTKGSFDGRYATYLSVIHPDDLAMVESNVEHALKEANFQYRVEHRILLADGGIRWLEGRGRVYRDASGRPMRMAGTVVDISDRKHSEEALRRADEKYRSIVEHAVYGIFQSSLDGHFISVNTAMARIYGYDTPEDMLQSISDIASQLYVDAADRAEFARMLQADGAIHGFEARNRKKNGSIIWVSSNARVVKDEKGRILYYEGTVEDITERRTVNAERERLLDELSAKNAELERFVYTVSHDLKSPLVTIVGFLGYVEEDLKTGDVDALHRDMDRIYRATFKMQDLLQDLLELSRIGRMMSDPVVVSFSALVDEAVELTEGRLHERGVDVRIQPNLPNVYGDSKRLLELVQNLIDNAAKYMGEQPKPRIEIGQDGFENDKPVFFVRDNGMGIDPDHHERIFGLFNKLNPNLEGTGVGLALVKRIVEFHGGRIWVESEVGKGATFRFSLPTGENSSGNGSLKSNA